MRNSIKAQGVFVFCIMAFTGIASASIAGDNILLTEIMPDAVESGVDNEYEWAEIYNPTGVTIDINGWEIQDAAGNDYVFDSTTDNTVMAPGEYRLLVLDAFDSNTNLKSFDGTYSGVLTSLPTHSDFIDGVDAIKLNNTGDFLEICSGLCDGLNQVDYVEWEDFSNTGLWNDDAGSGTGNSICREGISDTDTEADWSVVACNTDPTDLVNDGTPGTGTYGTFGIELEESGGSSEIVEGGATDAYSMTLDGSPAIGEIVTIDIASDAQCSINPSSITFDSTNWNVAQIIEIEATDDADIEPAHSCVVSHVVTSTNLLSPFHAMVVGNISVSVIDNDGLSVVVTDSRSGGKKPSRGPLARVVREESLVAIKNIEAPSACPYFVKYQRKGDESLEVKKIQDFLNRFYDEKLVVDGLYEKETADAIGRFQALWRKETLSHWGLLSPTKRWYQSTRKKANEVVGCDEGVVVLDNGVQLI